MSSLALVCLSPEVDGDEIPLEMPSYGVHRIRASAVTATGSAAEEIPLLDVGRMGYDAVRDRLLALAPSVLGFSVYVWSLPTLVRLAREIKAAAPETLVVFGGPSARTAMFDLAMYRPASAYLDAVCEGDGEAIIQQIALLDPPTKAGLAAVGGLYLPVPGGGWISTGPAPSMPLSEIPSPYAQGLMPRGAVGYLETYRGCPLGCRFCEWGVSRPARDVFPTEYLAKEIEHFRELQAPAVFLLDAGLNLNARGFRNLAAAHAETGFLTDTVLWAEIYPTIIKDEHIDFLGDVEAAYLGVGLQSIDPAVLKAHDRPFDMTRFGPAIEKLAKVAKLEVQIIFGLPGDTPEGFRRTLDFALSLPVWSVRAYHCLVLPDALLTRSRPEWRLKFNPETLIMQSNDGWSKVDFAVMRAELNEMAARTGGRAGDFWWSFRPGSAAA